MEFSREGLEELFTDGVVNPAAMSGPYLQNCTKFKELDDRVFLLYEPELQTSPNGAEFDIVLLHGIGSDEFTCWTNAQGILWPAVFLPQDFPTARVLTVGYAHSLFNWSEEESQPVETAAQSLPVADLAPSARSDDAEKTTEGEGGAFHHIKSFAERVGQTAKESVSTYAPKEVAGWWTGAADEQGSEKQTSNQPILDKTPGVAVDASKHSAGSRADLPTQKEPVHNVDKPLFQLLTRIRDSTGSLVAAEDESSAANLSGSAQPSGNAADDESKKASRDVRSLQSMRIVAAELAERLGNSCVGVGQRPVVFLVHSMGGLILKQMLISLFEAARLAPPSAAALSLAAVSKRAEPTADEMTVKHNCTAVRQANMLLRAVRGVVFYGTPHFGSAVASVITGLQKYYQGLGGLTPTSVVTGLGDHNKQELVRLNDRFFDVVERIGDELVTEAPQLSVSAPQSSAAVKNYMAAMEASLAPAPSVWTSTSGSRTSASHGEGGGEAPRGMVWILSFGETKKLNGLVRVVDPESANPAPEDPRYPFYLVNADHGEVCRPLTKMSPSYAMVYGLLDRMQQRGLLSWALENTSPQLLQGAALLPAPPSATNNVAKPSTIQRMCEEYESGWTALFDPARLPSTTLVDSASVASPLTVTSTSTNSSRPVESQRNCAAFQRGVGEMRLALPVLEAALADLHQLLHSFFGVAVPPQLDSIFLLAADMTDFVTRFYQREALIVQASGQRDTSKVSSGLERRPESGALVDEVVSFRVPLQLLTYWVQQATELLRVFELSQQERALNVNAVGAASPTTALWESNLSMHPRSRDLRELSELEQSVGVVQEEWESFRRYVSLRIRAVTTTGAVHGTSRKKKSRNARQENPSCTDDLADFSAREHIASLFFARAIRTIVSQHLHDGGALGGLLGAYLRSAILQIRGSEKQLSSTHFEHNPWVLIEDTASIDAASIVALVVEGLELSLTSSSASEDSSVLMDTSGSGIELRSDAELRAIVPALTATSSVLLGCFALFVDKLHRLDSGARWPRASAHFQLATASLRADFQVRSRLMRAASRTMRKEGLVPRPPQVDEKRSRSADKDWWRTAWELTTSKAETSAADGSLTKGDVADASSDSRQGHVAKLDDGLFLSAMQLVAESFQCSVLIQACRARRALLDCGHNEDSECVAARDSQKHGSVEQADGNVDSPVADAAAMVDDLAERVQAAQKTYLRTTQILRGVFAVDDTERPFGPQGREASKEAGDGDTGTGKQLEKSMKDQIREAIQGVLSDLDEDEAKESVTAAETHAKRGETSRKKAVKKGPSLSWTPGSHPFKRKGQPDALVSHSASSTTVATSTMAPAKRKDRKNSLPALIMNSLWKAWDAVRSGGAEAETPEHFAHTALVMWWMVEWEAVAAIKDAAPLLSTQNRAGPTTTVTATMRAKLRTLVEAVEAAQQRRKKATKPATSSSADAKSLVKPSRAPTPLAKAEEPEEAWERQCWLSANAATQCKWMTLRGGEEFLQKYQSDLCTEWKTLQQILSSSTSSQLRDLQDCFAPPSALLQLDGEGNTQLGIPSSLLDAVQHDDTSAALRCWLGHCYAAHRIRSPDTAHAYTQVIRNDYAAHKHYTPTAEVGLAWSHMHNVPCSFAQLWRAPRGATLKEQPGASAEAANEKLKSECYANVRSIASLLDYRSTGVMDTSALNSAPPLLLQFCHDAVRHHTDAVLDFISVRRSSPSPSSAIPRESLSSSALLHALSVQRPPADAGVLSHLRLAEEGFQRALSADPTNIGALCGLGRIRCLSVAPPLLNSPACVPQRLASFPGHAAASVRPGVGGVSSVEAVGFFSAALNAAKEKCLLPEAYCAGRQASPESCAHAMDNVWLSYAAYWMGEEARRTCVTGSKSPTKLDESEAALHSTGWLLKSLRYFPRNDWALTNLGLSHLATISVPASSPHGSGESSGDGQSSVKRDIYIEVSQLRGLALLERALAVNPTNMWALWGMGTYGTSAAHRKTCQHLLRTLILKNIPRL